MPSSPASSSTRSSAAALSRMRPGIRSFWSSTPWARWRRPPLEFFSAPRSSRPMCAARSGTLNHWRQRRHASTKPRSTRLPASIRRLPVRRSPTALRPRERSCSSHSGPSPGLRPKISVTHKPEDVMANALENTISLDGYAQVIVVLNTGAAAGAIDEADLVRHFLDPAVAGPSAEGTVLASESRDSLALEAPVGLVRIADAAAPPRMRVYPLLGLALGYVDQQGLASLRQAPEVEAVWRAEVPSLVRPVQVAAADPTGNPSWGVDRIG